MKILDYFEHPRFGVIVGSTDSKFDNFSDDEIKKKDWRYYYFSIRFSSEKICQSKECGYCYLFDWEKESQYLFIRFSKII